MKSILTPGEQVGFHREKGYKILLSAGFFFAFAIAYYFWLAPWFRDSPPERVNAIFYAFYSAFGVTVGALVLCGIGLLICIPAFQQFSKANKIKKENGI